MELFSHRRTTPTKQAHTSNQAATKIQRWFRNSRTEETSSDTNSVLVKVLNAKKKEINRKLQANKRRRETLKGSEYSPYLYDEKRASVSSYKEALLGNPVDFSTLLSSQNYSSQFSSQNSLNFKTSDYSTSILSLNPSKDHIFKFKDEDDEDDTFLQSKQKEYITKYIDVDFAIHKCGEIFPEPNGTVLPEETARPTDIKINNEALEKTSVDISPKQSSDAKKNLTNCTYQELLDTLKDFGKSETATTNEHVDKEDQQLSEKSEKSEKSKSQHLPVEENVSISSFIDRLTFLDNSDQIQNCTSSNLDFANEQILTLNIDLDQKNKTIQSLIEALNLQRSKNTELHNDMRRAIEKLNEQYEEVTEKHLSFIDELLSDKKELQHKCENISLELKNEKKETEDKLKSVEEKYTKQSRLNKFTQQVEKVGKYIKKNMEVEIDIDLEEQIKLVYDNELEELSRRYKKSIQNLKENIKNENSFWEVNLLRYCNFTELEENEEQIDQLRKDKDVRLEETINQVEREINLFLIESEKSALDQYRRLHIYHESDLRDQSKAFEDMQQKYMSMKQELNNMEARNNSLNATIRQNRLEMDRMNNLLQTVDGERKMLKDQMGQQSKDKINALEFENEKLKNEMLSIQSSYNEHVTNIDEQIKEIQDSKDAELENIQQKVQNVISKKDDVIANLHQQFDSAKKRAAYLEVLLDKQREELVFQ